MGSSPESLGMMGMLLPVLLCTERFSSGHFSTPPFLSSKGRLSEAKTTPFPFKHSPKRRIDGFLLPHLLCLIFPALLFRVAANSFKGWREGAWGHKLFFYNTKLCFLLPTPSPPPLLGSLLSSERLETLQLREDGDCGTGSLGADGLKGPELWADTVSCGLLGASHVAVSW